jgi:hypothetical protein
MTDLTRLALTSLGLRPPDPLAPGMPAAGAVPFSDEDGALWILLVEGSFECIAAPHARVGLLHAQVTRADDPPRWRALWTRWQRLRAIASFPVLARAA